MKKLVLSMVCGSILLTSSLYANDLAEVKALNLNKPDLIFAADVIRHGARTSTKYLPNLKYPSIWSENNIPPGQLTQYGYNMEKQNGKYFKDEYSNLINDPNQVCIVADGVNRDIVSALGVISGLFPEINNSDIIDPIPEAQDPILSMNKSIKGIDVAQGWLYEWKKVGYLSNVLLKSKYITSDEFCANPRTSQQAYTCIQPIAKFAGQMIALKDYCDQAGCSAYDTFTGINDSDYASLVELFNYNSYHSAVPSKGHGFSKLTKQYLTNTINTNGAVVVSQIIYNMNTIINSSPSQDHPKFILYTGHDTGVRFNIAYLLSKAGETKKVITKNPGYGADLSFKLYKSNDKYNVLVSYRQSYVTKDPVTIYQGSFKEFKKIYFNENELAKQQYPNCGSFQL